MNFLTPKRYLFLGLSSLLLLLGCSEKDTPEPTKNQPPIIENLSSSDVLVFTQAEFSKDKLVSTIKKYLLDHKKVKDETPKTIRVEILDDLSSVKAGNLTIKFRVVDDKGQKSTPSKIHIRIKKTIEGENKAPVIKEIQDDEKITVTEQDFNQENILSKIKKYLLDNDKIIDEAPEDITVELTRTLPQKTAGSIDVYFIIKDEKGQKSNEASIKVELIKSQEAISFPTEIEQLLPEKLEIQTAVDFSKIKAVTTKGEQVSPTKIAVNGQEAQAENYTFNTAGAVEIIFTFSADYTPATLKKTIQVHYKESAYAEVDTRADYEWLGIEVEEHLEYQTHSAKWPRKGVNRSQEYGYFEAKLAIDALNKDFLQTIETQLRNEKIGWVSFDDQYFESDKIEDSGNNGKYDDHNETQLRNFLGENRVALTGEFDLGPRNGEYILRAINWRVPGVKEIEQYHLKKLIYSSCAEGTVKSTWTEEYWNEGLAGQKPFAEKLAKGEAVVYIIMSNWDRELVTWEEAHTPEGIGKLVNVLTLWLYANPKSAKGIKVVTFDRTGASQTNSYMSEKLMKLLHDNGGEMYFAPSMMPTLGHDDRSPNTYTVNMFGQGNNNSYGSVRYMADLSVARAFEKKGIAFPFKNFKDSKGAGYGKMLEYDKVKDVLFAFEQLSSAVNLSGKTSFKFRDILPDTMIKRYSENLRINTPWAGWITIDTPVDIKTIQKYNLTEKGFILGTQISNKGIRAVHTWKPEVQF